MSNKKPFSRHCYKVATVWNVYWEGALCIAAVFIGTRYVIGNKLQYFAILGPVQTLNFTVMGRF